VYTDLHHAGVIDDPLAAFGDWKTAWVGRTSWRYTRQFTGEPFTSTNTSRSNALLFAEGIETNATVKVNGEVVLTADDSWLTYTADITHLLLPGTNTNTIEVTFSSVYDSCEFSNPTMARDYKLAEVSSFHAL
jgi:beta-mannosidase